MKLSMNLAGMADLVTEIVSAHKPNELNAGECACGHVFDGWDHLARHHADCIVAAMLRGRENEHADRHARLGHYLTALEAELGPVDPQTLATVRRLLEDSPT